MKKFLCLIFALIPVTVFAKPDKNQQFLINQGIELCSRIKEKASCEAYLNLLVLSPEMMELAKSAGKGDYTNLESVIRVKINEKSFYDLSGIDCNQINVPENLKKDLNDGIEKAFPMIVNGRLGGEHETAVSTLLTVSAVFDADFSFDNYTYIFNFKDAFPVCVFYSHGKDKAVSAAACIIFDRNFINENLDFITTEKIK